MASTIPWSALTITAAAESRQILQKAEALGIPWKRILSREIAAETIVRRFVGDDLQDLPLWHALCVLPSSHLHSWRVRESIDRLAWQAVQGSREARAELTQLHAALMGKRSRRRARDSALAMHHWFAYQRVLELQALAELAQAAPAGADSIEFLTRSSGCSRSDAQWASSGSNARTAFHALEEAMRRAREEGFEIPLGKTESQAFIRLRACVRRYGFLPKRSAARMRGFGEK